MKKRAFVFTTMCFLLLFLTSCSQTINQSSKNVLSNNSTTSSNLKKNTEVKGHDVSGITKLQDISDITKLTTPDELVYLHDGIKKIYTKDNPKFKKVLQMNRARQTKKLGEIGLYIDKDVRFYGDYLIYQYTNTNYAPVYFELAPPLPDPNSYWVINYYDRNATIPSDEKDYRSRTQIFGGLAPADELLSYLKK